jgi:glycosyltransferase involved in cell wall biosynthesis
VAETIESIIAQTYQNWELLITDDCSTDNSCEVIRSYARKDARIRLLQLPQNSGAGVARNNSIAAAQGRFIAFCDSDDRWMPHKLERQLKFMTDHDYSLTYTSYVLTNEQGAVTGYVECLKSMNYLKIIRDNGIGCLTSIYDARKIGKFYMPTIRKRQDWCLWINIIRRTGTAYGLREPLAIYRVRNNSISSNKMEMLKYNYAVYKDVLGFSTAISMLLLTFYFLPYYFYKKFKQQMMNNKKLSAITPPQRDISICISGNYMACLAA